MKFINLSNSLNDIVNLYANMYTEGKRQILLKKRKLHQRY